MGGLFILVLGAAYFGIALYVTFAKVKPWWGKVVALVVFAMIPTVDAVYGRAKLRQMCKEEGGLKVYRVVQDVEGFFSDSLNESLLKKYDFSFIESPGLTSGLFIRYIKLPSGQIVKERTGDIKSKYEARFFPGNPRDVYMKDAFRVTVRDTNEILGVVINFNYAGGWVERFAASTISARASAGTCELTDSIQIIEQLVAETLKPVIK